MTALAILGGGQDQMHLIRTAVSMNLRPVVYDRFSDIPGAGFALNHDGVFRRLDFSQTEEVIRDLEGMNRAGYEVRGVLTMGCDCTRSLAAIARHFGWVGPSPETAELTTDKWLMAQRWFERRINHALCEVFPTGVVIRPRHSSGSRGVQRAEGQYVASELEEGPQVSSETVLWDGRAVTFLADRNYEDTRGYLPQVLENGGWFPCSQPPEVQERLVHTAEQGARALGIIRGTAKGDLVVAQGYPDDRVPKLLEMAARLSGGDFCESLVPLGCGVNYVRQAIEIALGQEPTWEELEPRNQQVVANRYFFTPPGVLEAWEGPNPATVEKFELWCRAGEQIHPIRSHAGRRGVFVVAGADRAEVQRKIDTVYADTRFRIDGRWYSGDPREMA